MSSVTSSVDSGFMDGSSVGSPTISEGESANSSQNDDINAAPEDETSRIQAVLQSVFQTRLNNVQHLFKMFFLYFGTFLLVWILGWFGFSILWLCLGSGILIYVSEIIENRKLSTKVVKFSADDKNFINVVKDMYQLNGKFMPSWIYFPDVERAEWLNRFIGQLWPYVREYVRKLIKEQIETSIQDSSPLLKSFTFTDVELGTRAPNVSGLKTYDSSETRRDEIIIDMQLSYDSECNIGVSLNHLNAGIKDLHIRGLLRLEFKPLMDTMPLVGAIGVSFVQDPSIDFDLKDLANIFDLPGIDALIRGSILDSIRGIMVTPEKYIVKMTDEADIFQLKYPTPKGVIRVHILEAANLIEADPKFMGMGGGSDPFTIVSVGKVQQYQTKVISHNLNPVWDESFDVAIYDLATPFIDFEVFDHDNVGKRDKIGKASIQVASVYERAVVDDWLRLSGVKTGSIHVRMEWFDLTNNPEDRHHVQQYPTLYCVDDYFVDCFDEFVLTNDQDDDDCSSLPHVSGYVSADSLPDHQMELATAHLNIFVDSALHLPDSEQDHFNPSPQLKIILPGMKKPLKTLVATSTVNPVWEENFPVLINSPDNDLIKFEVENSIQGSTMASCTIPVSDVMKAADMKLNQPFQLESTNPQSVLNLRLALKIMKLKKVDNKTLRSSGRSFSRKSRIHALKHDNSSFSSEDNEEGGQAGIAAMMLANKHRRLESIPESGTDCQNDDEAAEEISRGGGCERESHKEVGGEESKGRYVDEDKVIGINKDMADKEGDVCPDDSQGNQVSDVDDSSLLYDSVRVLQTPVASPSKRGSNNIVFVKDVNYHPDRFSSYVHNLVDVTPPRFAPSAEEKEDCDSSDEPEEAHGDNNAEADETPEEDHPVLGVSDCSFDGAIGRIEEKWDPEEECTHDDSVEADEMPEEDPPGLRVSDSFVRAIRIIEEKWEPENECTTHANSAESDHDIPEEDEEDCNSSFDEPQEETTNDSIVEADDEIPEEDQPICSSSNDENLGVRKRNVAKEETA